MLPHYHEIPLSRMGKRNRIRFAGSDIFKGRNTKDMCGVIGLIYESESRGLGETAVRLLKMLEYRGYDSTGAIVQDCAGKTTLLKDVGAPSEVSYTLGIDKLAGRIFCGQVRWATFGVVTRENAQPHEVRCKTHFYGAHNGNITNCKRLKDWLLTEGHDVKSDNDGEMLVHTIEHFFAAELAFKDQNDFATREKALRSAILQAAKKVTGSFAAVVVDPVTELVAAIKAGSSLYLGLGTDPERGAFTIASSDLASVLQLTRILLAIKEHEFAVFSPKELSLFDLKTGRKIKRNSQRSLLKVEETKLQPPFKYFMEQEIYSQVQATRKVIALFTGGDTVTRLLREKGKKHVLTFQRVKSALLKLSEITDQARFQEECLKFLRMAAFRELRKFSEILEIGEQDLELGSSHATLLEEIRNCAPMPDPELSAVLKCVDSIFEWEDVEELEKRIRKFVQILGEARRKGRTIYILACGSSFHAAKTAPLFFNEIAGMMVVPLLPGEFRAQCTNSLCDGDVVIGISQSGETKDLIDVFNLAQGTGRKVARICVLNNTNSTLALEKSDLFIPLFCGPEIAVPATKSFVNQLLVMLILAIKVREGSAGTPGTKSSGKKPAKGDYGDLLGRVPDLIDKTLKTTQKETDEVAAELFLKPSIHILATRILGIAKEGALKIREIVLNHTEGFEGSEFKHGPNTILGVNTVFGLDAVAGLSNEFCAAIRSILERESSRPIEGISLYRLFKSVVDFAFRDEPPTFLSPEETELFHSVFENHNFFRSMYSNYPLVFISGPDQQDVNLTISQINTHKIRGANVFMIAEDNEHLREAISIPPASNFPYRFGYVTLPRTGNLILSVFSIAVVLQVLSMKMSQRKMEFLDRLEIENHGVHPDVPKNVSKSITVD